MKKQTWFDLAVIQFAGATSLPMFIISQNLASVYGFQSAIISIILGNLMLMFLALVPAWSSSFYKKSTAQCIIDAFGPKGKIFIACMVISFMGWFGIHLEFISMLLQKFEWNISGAAVQIIFGVLVTLLATGGIKFLRIFAFITFPLFVIVMGITLWFNSNLPYIEKAASHTSSFGVSFIIGAAIALVVDIPNYFREAKSQKDALVAVIILFGLLIPFLEISAAYLTVHSVSDNIFDILTVNSFSSSFNYFVLIFLVLAGCVANIRNLYSAAINMKEVFPQMSSSKKIIIIGLIGTFLSCLNIFNDFQILLEFIGIILGSTGAVLIGHFLSNNESEWQANVVAWVLGVAGCILLKIFDISFTEISELDAFMIALSGIGLVNYILDAPQVIEVDVKDQQ